jgi:hypothetical protein
MSLLKPEVSIGVALATGAIVAAVYFNALPPLADVRVAPQSNRDIAASRKVAAWTSAGIVAAVSLVAKDPTVFTAGAFFTFGMDWWYRHANAVDPRSGKVTATSVLSTVSPALDPGAGAAPEFSDDFSGSEFAY